MLTEDRQNELYLARRMLHFAQAEWDKLPWWVQRTYVDGMVRELSSRGGTSPAGVPAPPGLADIGEIGENIGDSARLGHKELTLDTSTGAVRRVGRPRT